MLNRGDLVEVTMIGSEYYKCKGIILDKIYYDGALSEKDTLHKDEYSCKLNVRLDRSEANKYITVRAKWLKLLSRGQE